ncbi:MAG: CocE/NonD family hydrolase [Pirellulales bacterium]
MVGRRIADSLAVFLLAAASAWAQTAPAPKTYAELPSEIPEKFAPTLDGYDHERREVMVPMRDGVKLHTVILVPKGAKGAPILLTRTPYDADSLTKNAESVHLEPVLTGYDNAADVVVDGGYIRVVQDIRGKHNSEGDYIINRPLRGPLNPTPVDHSTDTYDTVDWLVKNVPESNGKVGILGISYDGFLPLMALVDPHPALKVSVPMNPMVDGWLGDDWFHYGAFRQLNVWWIYRQVGARKAIHKLHTTHHDVYDMFLDAGSAGELGRRKGLDQLGFWRKLTEHPSYDSFWREQAVDKLLGARPLSIPTMLVHGYWDQEDIYGAPAVYRALEPKDKNNDKVFLVMGPWFHGQQIEDGSKLGAIHFGSDTSRHFRREILAPFLAQYLKDGAPKANVAPVVAYETGTNVWRSLPKWPAAEGDRRIEPTPLYLRAGSKLAFEGPLPGETAYDEYVSDPAKPTPFRRRPIQPMGYGDGLTWAEWLVDDQREASGRTDVATFTSQVLDKPVQISGLPIANLVAATSGTDSDWVVKLIDVYPDEVASQPEMGGYQLMIAADIFRGRYRQSFEQPQPIEPFKPLVYRFELPTANHVFLPGHRIMVQVQSAWFPLYDRNPQTFVPNIFWAKPGDYKSATQRIYHAPQQTSFVELPVVQ